MMAIASESKPMTRLHQAIEQGWCDKRTILEQGITIITRSEYHQNKVWIATLKQGRSTSAKEEYEEVEDEESPIEQAHK